MNDWNVVWSKYLHKKISSIAFVQDCIIISAEATLSMMDNNGDILWLHHLPSSVYEIGTYNDTILILFGRGFQILNPEDGTPIFDGKTAESGFSKWSFRPGGGLLLSDRFGNLHLFDKNAKGKKMIDNLEVREILGWLNREVFLIHKIDGSIYSIDINDEKNSNKIGNKTFSWSSKLEKGKLICQSTDGSIWEGVPNQFSWDFIEDLGFTEIEPMKSSLVNGNWYILTFQGDIINLENIDSAKRIKCGDFYCSDNQEHIVTCTREGLLRWWETTSSIEDKNEYIFQEVEERKKELNRKQRKRIFETASEAEKNNIDEAIRLYRVIGRESDVKRLEKQIKKGD